MKYRLTAAFLYAVALQNYPRVGRFIDRLVHKIRWYGLIIMSVIGSHIDAIKTHHAYHVENARRNITHHRLTRATPSRYTWDSIRLSAMAELGGSTRWAEGFTAK